MEKVSIIVPVYNVEPYITDCLQSVMRQTYAGPLECILVDDCSVDRSMAVAEQMISEYAGPIEFRIIRHEHNRGASAARNTGMDVSTGDYVFFLDSDDFIDDNTIEILYAAICSDDYVIAIGYFTGFLNNKDFVYKHNWVFEKPRRIEANEFGFMMLTQKSNFASTAKLYDKKKVLSQVRFQEGRINEDTLLAMDLIPIVEENHFSCIELPFYSYHYRMRDNSVCHQSVFRLDVAYIENIAIAIERYKDRPELANWLRQDQMKRAYKAIRDKEIDKKSYFKVSNYIRIADRKTIREVTTKKAYFRMLLVKHLPGITWLLEHKLNII